MQCFLWGLDKSGTFPVRSTSVRAAELFLDNVQARRITQTLLQPLLLHGLEVQERVRSGSEQAFGEEAAGLDHQARQLAWAVSLFCFSPCTTLI